MFLKEIIEFHRSVPIPRDKTNIQYEIPYLHYGDIYKIYNVKLNLVDKIVSIIKVSNDLYNEKYQIYHNNIVMNLTSENYTDLGKSIIIKNPNNEKFIAGMETHLIKIISKNIIADYMNYYFQSNIFKKTIQQFVTGMKVFRVKPIDILNINMEIPSFTIQQHIVDIIGSVDDKIENNDKMMEKMFNYCKICFLSIIKNPSELNPKKISEIAKEVITGTTPSTKVEEYWNGEYNFVTIPDMQNGIFTLNTERTITSEAIKKCKTRIIKPYSLIVSCIATVGLVSINENLSLTNQQINSLVLKNDYDLYYLHQYMLYINDELKLLGTGGSTTLNINKQLFSNIDILYPSQEKLLEYNNKVEPFYKQILYIQKENKKLNELKQLYLNKFFN